MDRDEAAAAFRDFVAVVQALRTPETGCPWDLEQDHRSLRPYLVEEAYEVLDAIDRGDDPGLGEELGDLLLQVVLHAQLADDRGAFSITEVVRGIKEKMVRRHPHVFGTERVSGAAEVVRNWDAIKAVEAGAKGGSPSHAAALARIPAGLPALHRAQRLGEKAVKRGSAVDNRATLDAVRDGLDRLEAGAAPEELEKELGEVLFALCQVARRLGVSAEDSLRAANRRFVERFCQEGEATEETG